jgi:hypothetical protein
VRPRRALAAALALALLAPSALRAQEGPAAAVPEARMERARELARLTSPNDILLATNLAGWEAALARSLALDPGMAKLEAEYPGVGKAGIEAARPLARRYCQAFIDKAVALKAAHLARGLTAAEIEEAISFFGSPVGQSVIRQLFASVDMEGIGRDLATQRVQTGSAAIDPERVRREEREATRRAAAKMSAADHLAIMRFQQKPVAKKMIAVQAGADREIIELANHPDPEWLSRQSDTVRAAALAYVDARKK